MAVQKNPIGMFVGLPAKNTSLIKNNASHWKHWGFFCSSAVKIIIFINELCKAIYQACKSLKTLKYGLQFCQNVNQKAIFISHWKHWVFRLFLAKNAQKIYYYILLQAIIITLNHSPGYTIWRKTLSFIEDMTTAIKRNIILSIIGISLTHSLSEYNI